MAFKRLLPLQNLNFQMNRVLGYGPKACREEELLEIAPKLQDFNPKVWFDQWNMLALRAESDGRLMHAAYYHRMSEFFLPENVPEKAIAYEDFSRCFYAAMKDENLEVFKVPYEDTSLPAIARRYTGSFENMVGPVLLGEVELEDPPQQEAPDGLLDVSRISDDGWIYPSIEKYRAVTVLDQKELERKGNPTPAKKDPKKLW